MQEITRRRTETSKAYDLGGRRRGLDCHIGAIHYKDNYADPKEQWKDIDLTWKGNRIMKAPFELTVEGSKITFRDKKTNKVSVLEVAEVEGKVVPALNWVFSKGKASSHITDKVELCLEVGRGGIKLHRGYLAKCLPVSIKIKQSGELTTLSYGKQVTGDVSI